MTDAQGADRNATTPGARSPASEEAKQQGMSGVRGAEQAQPEGIPGQPAQASNRRSAEHEPAPEQRKSFAPGQAPSEQGDGEPSPEQIAKHQQGIGRQSGSHAGQGDRSEELAQQGPPSEEHTRHGRQQVPGDRQNG